MWLGVGYNEYLINRNTIFIGLIGACRRCCCEYIVAAFHVDIEKTHAHICVKQPWYGG